MPFVALATGSDDLGRTWAALYCDRCAQAISDEHALALDEQRREAGRIRGQGGDYCPDCHTARQREESDRRKPMTRPNRTRPVSAARLG